MRTLVSDQTLSPTPDDFSSTDGYALWQNQMGTSLQEVLADLMQSRFLNRPNQAEGRKTAVDVFFKVVKAEGLVAKEGKSRDPYCKIEFGAMPDENNRVPPNSPPPELFMTEVITGSTAPKWNQHLNLAVKDLSDKIVVSVWDRRKDDFLGQAKLTMGDLIQTSSREGYLSGWYRLGPRDGRNKDKYVGGNILIEFTIRSTRDQGRDPVGFIESNLLACKINFKALYKTLLRSCLTLDMLANPAFQADGGKAANSPERASEEHYDLLSDESKMVLKIWAQKWFISDAYAVIAFLELLVAKYKRYDVPVRALLDAYETLYTKMKIPEWLSQYEKPVLAELLEDMYAYYKTQITNYKEVYEKNKPDEALENTILLLRMISKNTVFRESHPDLPTSFRSEIRCKLMAGGFFCMCYPAIADT
jgi:hypothetical protein